MKNTGVEGLLSSYDLENSTLLPSTNLLPIFSSTKFLQKGKAPRVSREQTHLLGTWPLAGQQPSCTRRAGFGHLTA